MAKEMTLGVHEWSAIEALAAFDRGDIEVARYADALLARCVAERALNAFISLDEDAVRAAARDADLERRHGRARPLAGLPIAVKDNIHVAGTATTAGTPGLANHRPPDDSALVAILRRAGTIPFGKTNMHELGGGFTSNNAAYGAVRNPYARDRITGGSSGGSAAAVAARLVPVAIGTDTAGSLRVPAALCGVVGFRPTSGRYPHAGIVPLTPIRDTAGPMARTVADVALIDGVVTGDYSPLAPVDLRGLRLGVARAYFYEGLDAEVSEVIEAELARLSNLGVELIEVDLPGVGDCALRCRPIIDREISVYLRRYLADTGAGVTLEDIVRRAASPDVQRLVDAPFMFEGGGVTDEAYRYALEYERPELQATFARCFADHRIAAIILPTTPFVARPIAGAPAACGVAAAPAPPYGRNTTPSSNAGIPGLSLPAALGKSGLPVGIEIQGPAGSDRRLLAVGAAYERSRGPFPPP